MNLNDIKALVPLECPHCRQTVVVSFISHAPNLTGVFTPEMLEEAKKEAIKQIEALGLPEETTKQTIDWIKDETTIFGPSDVKSILENFNKNEQS